MKQVVLASGNPGKLAEFQRLLKGAGFEVLPLSEFTDESPAETGLSFVENAILKARFACQRSGLPALADDSGLAVDALRGQPGIYSARFAGAGASDQDNIHKLLNSLEGLTSGERAARFQCVLAFMRHAEDPTPLIAAGHWAGRILHAPAGSGGFGYDPVFYVPETQCSAAELSKDDKNRLSHRGKALQQLLGLLSDEGSAARD